MKTKTKKCGVYAALAAVLLITAALITSCPPPIGELSGGPTLVRVTLGGGNALTVMPGGAIDPDDYDRFTITAYEGTPASPGATLTFSGGGTYTSVTALQAATAPVTATTTYTIKVDASISDGETTPTYIPTSSGTSTFTASAGTNPVPIELIPVLNTSGKGTFAWNVTYAGGTSFAALTTATIKLGALAAVSLTATGTIPDVPTGVHDVTITLERTDAGTPPVHYAPLVYTDKVHIYNTMTSTLTETFPALTVVPTYTVTFYNTTGSATGGPEDVVYIHGEVVTAADDYATASLHTLEYTSPTTPGQFMGWYTIAGGLGVHFPLTNKVFNTRDLFGKYYVATQASPGDLTFSLPPNPAAGMSLGSLAISAATLNTEGPSSGNTYNLTAEGVPAGYTVTYKVGTYAPAASLVIGFARNNGGTPDIDDLLIAGNTLAITVIATSPAPESISYSSVLLVTIVAGP